MRALVMVAVDRLCEEPFASILCYPSYGKIELERRLKELQKLSIGALEFVGEKEILGIPVLGKGCVGIVTVGYKNGEKVALKIRRVDADRVRMQREAQMLRKANSVRVGPRFLGVSKNFLLMEFVDGVLFPEWLEKCKRVAHVRKVLRGVLEQCWRLDKTGLDHGELNHAPKHIIVSNKGKPVIVDFETASVNRRSSNVTSVCQFLFMTGVVAEKVAGSLGERNKKAMIEVLRRYKNVRSRENLERVLTVCGL